MKKEVVKEGKLNEVIIHRTKRANGTIRVQRDYEFCPSLAEQHTGHLTDLNYLIAKYKPDELQAYITQRNLYRQEIVGHDFSKEPNLQEAQNVVYRSRKEFEALPDEVRTNFKNHLEFLKFIDNPANAEKMIKLGLLTPKQIEKVKIEDEPVNTPTPTKTQDEE